MTLRTLNYGNYGIFLIMGNAGFCPSTVARVLRGAEMDSGGFGGPGNPYAQGDFPDAGFPGAPGRDLGGGILKNPLRVTIGLNVTGALKGL